MDGLLGKEEADGKVRAGGQVDVGPVADGERAGWDGDGGASAEGEAGGGDEIDRAASLADGDVRGADGERVGAELIGEDDADHGAADGDVDDPADGGAGGSVDYGPRPVGSGAGCGG